MSQASNYTLVAPSLLISLGHNPPLGGHNSRLGGHMHSFKGHGSGMPPVALALKHATVLQNSFEFVNQLSKIQNLLHKVLVSFDVKSLFTNIPLDLTLNLILDKLFIDQSTKIFEMHRKRFNELLDWTCKNGTHQFNGKFTNKLIGWPWDLFWPRSLLT